jgi:serine/tyrosine/threonine adenylyltransferase
MTTAFAFDNSYARLPDRFFVRQQAEGAAAPSLLAYNEGLARTLGLPANGENLLQVLAGNQIPDGAEPLSQAYAGHQFGGWNPQLGDGRALLLGEVIGTTGQRFDIQLKGAGRTPWSRGGDGRAWMGPVLREYLVSEAMFAMGVPTTRALAAVATGEGVIREEILPGAILTRVAKSHIRVGTFQYFAARNDVEALEILTDHVIARHYPGAQGALGLVQAVIAAQASLIAGWMGLGFIHGVMNTDNMAVSGETIDYGPCAFMDTYNPGQVYSSIDRGGRYQYQNQPGIAAWNLAQLASALLPLMGEREAAIKDATAAVNRFPVLYQAASTEVFARKLGITHVQPTDFELAEVLLNTMTAEGLDFTNTFRDLAKGDAPEAFKSAWQARIASEPDPEAVMSAANPAFIPRNHLVEAMISAARQGDMEPFKALHEALKTPFSEPANPDFTRPPEPHEVVQATFCGT